MSDFSTFNDFRKGYKLKQNNQFADPTYLSFALMFDYTSSSSPLLSGAARTFIKENTDAEDEYDGRYGPRLKALDDFLLALKKINQDMPWYWQSLSGIDALQKYDPNKPFRGGDDAKISIGTLESLDLTIAGLMHLYRTACFDESKWSYILPCNLRKFRVWVYVTEVRQIKNLSKIAATLGFDKDSAKDSLQGGETNLGDAFSPDIGVSNANENISGTGARPYFLFELGNCEWDMTTGTSQFAALQKSPEGFAASEIAFTYETVGKVDARVLNGTIVETETQSARLSPATEKESRLYDPNDFGGLLGDKIDGKIEEMGDRFADDAALFMERKKQQVGQLGSEIYRANVPNFENIYSNAVAGVDSATDISTLSDNIPQNIFGLTPGATVQDAFDQGAVAGLNIGENVNADDNTTNSGTGGGNTLGNIHGK